MWWGLERGDRAEGSQVGRGIWVVDGGWELVIIGNAKKKKRKVTLEKRSDDDEDDADAGDDD